MASVDFKKHKSGAAKAMLMHCDKVERPKREHKNPHIDTSKTHLNRSIIGRSYREACEAYDARMAELDAQPGANKRKDRVTLLGLDVTRPAALTNKARQMAWFRRVWQITADRYGAENMIDGYLHVDEVHDYIDPDTREHVTSREHLQMYVIPERNGRLCAKECTSREAMISINNEIQEMSLKEFGVKFMTGEKRKSRGTVEQMKTLSEMAARAEAAEQAAEAAIAAMMQAQDARQAAEEAAAAVQADALASMSVEAEAAEQAAEAAIEAMIQAQDAQQAAEEAAAAAQADARDEIKLQEKRLQEREKRLQGREAAVSNRERQQQAKADEFQRREDALEAQRLALQEREQAVQQEADKVRAAAKSALDEIALREQIVGSREEDILRRTVELTQKERDHARIMAAGRRALGLSISSGISQQPQQQEEDEY